MPGSQAMIPDGIAGTGGIRLQLLRPRMDSSGHSLPSATAPGRSDGNKCLSTSRR